MIYGDIYVPPSILIVPPWVLLSIPQLIPNEYTPFSSRASCATSFCIEPNLNISFLPSVKVDTATLSIAMLDQGNTADHPAEVEPTTHVGATTTSMGLIDETGMNKYIFKISIMSFILEFSWSLCTFARSVFEIL